jgi:hypothetical protein
MPYAAHCSDCGCECTGAKVKEVIPVDRGHYDIVQPEFPHGLGDSPGFRFIYGPGRIPGSYRAETAVARADVA